MATPSQQNPNAGGASEAETRERFFRRFQEEATTIQDQIAHLENLALVAGERQDAIDHCLAAIARLSSDVSDATDFLPAYDQRSYSEALKALSEELQKTRAKLSPKKRFSFQTSRKNGSAISLNDVAQLPSSEPETHSTKSSVTTTLGNETDSLGELPTFSKNYNEEISKRPDGGSIRKPSFSQASQVLIAEHTGVHIILPPSASHATTSGTLADLKKCIVDMSLPTVNGKPFAGLALNNIKNSLIIAGQVAGAAHITGVENSVIAVSSRQVRMHDCKNVDIYLYCASRPIIEDCSGLRFAPLPKCYTTEAMTTEQNQWDQVDDFKWLKVEHSPNWSVLPEEQRLKEEIWTKVVPGGHGMGLDDILKRVGLKA